MPWQTIQKSYGKDARYDSIYHIRYNEVNLSFDVICKYVGDGYKWLLYSDCPSLANVLLGTSPEIGHIKACELALDHIGTALDSKIQGLSNARESLTDHLGRQS